jgi:protein-L-isoaspartate(D-aspartate) O-methyltransferase
MDDLDSVRRWYAQEVRYAAGVKSEAVVCAFAAAPREGFLGPGPWQICTGASPNKYWSTEDADPRSVYPTLSSGCCLSRGEPGT